MLSFHSSILHKGLARVTETVPLLIITLINCLINLELISIGRKNILQLYDKGSLMTLSSLQSSNFFDIGVILCAMLNSILTIHIAHKARVLGELWLLSSKKVYHLYINTNKLLLLLRIFFSIFFTTLYFSFNVVE